MIRPVRRFRALPHRRQRLLQCELALVLLLVALALLLNGRGGGGEAITIVAFGYAVGLTTHVILVLVGWEPRLVRRMRDR